MRVFVIRHGETEMNADGIVQGPVHDAPLSSRGRAQAEAVAARFARTRIDAVYASPLSRAHETGESIAKRVDAPFFTTPEFVEFHWGKYCGRRQTGTDGDEMTDIVRRWRAGDLTLAPEGGESPAAAAERARHAFAAIVEKHDVTESRASASPSSTNASQASTDTSRPSTSMIPLSANATRPIMKAASAWSPLADSDTNDALSIDDAPSLHADAANARLNRVDAQWGATIVIVAHGRLNKILLATILDNDLRCMEDYPQANTGVTLLEGPRPNWGASFVNDTGHLLRAGLSAPVNHLRERA